MGTGRYHIIGAGRGMGRWFAQQLVKRSHVVFGYDLKLETLEGLPSEINKRHIHKDNPYNQYATDFGTGDVVLLAVPQSEITNLEHDLVKVASKCLVVSLTSVQTGPMEILRGWGLSIPPLGCHALFGATVGSGVGQIIALTDYQVSEQSHHTFSDHLRELGLIPTYLTPEDHDRFMGLVQVLPHFSFLVFVKCLTSLSKTPSVLFDLRTPNFEFMHAFACRFLKIAPSTTGAIQYAPDAPRIRSGFLAAAQELSTMFDAADSIDAAAKVIDSVREPLPGAHVDEGVQIAQVAVDSVQRFAHLLHRHMSKELPFVFRNRLSGEIHVVRILRNNSTDVEYEEATIMRDGRYAIGLDEISKKNYARIGLAFGKPMHESIKKRNIVLLEGDELSLFWRERVLQLSLRMNATNPLGLKETFFETWLPQLVPGVRSCTFHESFRKRGENERVTLDVLHGARYDQEELANKIRMLVQEFKL